MTKQHSRPPTRRRPDPGALALAALTAWLLLPFGAEAGPPGGKLKGAPRPSEKARKDGVRKQPQDEFEFWFDLRRTKLAAAAQVVGVGDPFTVIAMRLRMRGWDEPVPTEAPPLDPAWLRSVRDEKPFLDMRARAPEDLKSPALREGYEEYLAYCQAILLASQIPADAFAKSAAENPTLTFGHLYREPRRHRGQVIHMQGRLKRITQHDPPPLAERQGVKAVYEAYIFPEHRKGAPPVIVIFTDLPPTLEVREDYEEPPLVAFDAYFFKKHRWVSGKVDPKGRREVISSLMFIGPTLAVQEAPARPGGRSVMPIPAPVLYGAIGFVGLALLMLIGVNLWYRQGDRKVRARLRELQAQRFRDEALGGEPPGGPAQGDGQAPGAGAPQGLGMEPPPPQGEGGKTNGLPPDAPGPAR
jgi:hypothetical protein